MTLDHSMFEVESTSNHSKKNARKSNNLLTVIGARQIRNRSRVTLFLLKISFLKRFLMQPKLEMTFA